MIEDSSVNTSINHSITFISLLSNYTFMTFASVAFIAYFHFCYMEPVLALRFSDFDLSPFKIGFMFCIRDAGYTVSLLIMSFYLTEERNINRKVMTIGLFIAGISHFFLGPAEFLPNNLALMMFGQFMMSFGSGIFFIPILPEMIKVATKMYPNQQIEASDISAGVLNFMF
jgi:sugar phosphate permease